MEKDCGYYFLTATALSIWRENDLLEGIRLNSCIDTHKKAYFGRVMRKSSPIAWHTQMAMAEDAFNTAKMVLIAGINTVKSEGYMGFFFEVFKNTYLRLEAKERGRLKRDGESIEGLPSSTPSAGQTGKDEPSAKLIFALKQIGEDCRELIWARHVEEMTIEEIMHATKGKYRKKKSLEQKLWRCRESFKKIWNKLSQV